MKLWTYYPCIATSVFLALGLVTNYIYLENSSKATLAMMLTFYALTILGVIYIIKKNGKLRH